MEAERGRINFKVGAEKKKPFALTDATTPSAGFENAWGMRLGPAFCARSQSDRHGQVRVSVTWLRAATLRETPVQFNLQWNEAQLGQLSKLLSGEDRGWRGTVSSRPT